MKYDLDRSMFISASVFFSILFLPMLAMCVIGLCLEFIWSVFIAGFVLLAIFAALLIFFWVSSHKHTHYLLLQDGEMKIVYSDAFSTQTKQMSLRYDQIKQIEYYRLHSLLSWIQLVFNYTLPMCVYLTYESDADGEEYSAMIGHLRLCEVKEISMLTSIGLKLR